jgi:hypothetical protein
MAHPDAGEVAGKERQDVIQIKGLGPEASSPAGPADEDARAIVALRERAATALERGLGFVLDYGDELAALRAHVVLEVVEPAAVIARVSAQQRDDGAFPPFGFVFSGARSAELRAASAPPELVGVLEALAVLADVRGLVQPVAERAVAYLERVQRSDGSWGFADPVADAGDPDLAKERAAADRLFTTGMLGGYALRTPFVRPDVIEWTSRFLTGLWEPGRVEGGRLSSIAAFAHFFANGGAPDLADEALQWCGRELERGFRSHRFEAVDTLRVLFYCDARALPGATFDVVELLDRLLAEQVADGGFAALDPGGPPGRVAPSIDALMGIRALCKGL